MEVGTGVHVRGDLRPTRTGIAGRWSSRGTQIPRDVTVEGSFRADHGLHAQARCDSTSHSIGHGSSLKKRQWRGLPVDYRFLKLLLSAAEDPEVSLTGCRDNRPFTSEEEVESESTVRWHRTFSHQSRTKTQRAEELLVGRTVDGTRSWESWKTCPQEVKC